MVERLYKRTKESLEHGSQHTNRLPTICSCFIFFILTELEVDPYVSLMLMSYRRKKARQTLTKRQNFSIVYKSMQTAGRQVEVSREKAKFEHRSLRMHYPKVLNQVEEQNDVQQTSITSFFKNKHIVCSLDIAISFPILTGYHYKTLTIFLLLICLRPEKKNYYSEQWRYNAKYVLEHYIYETLTLQINQRYKILTGCLLYLERYA